jgi:RNA polymerase sigma-70 factor, ECF subfamily
MEPADDSSSEETWVRLYRETVGPLYGYASRRVGGDRAFAEDLVQEAFLRALDRWRVGGPPAEPLAWLRTVVRNLVLNHQRARRPRSLEERELDLEGEPVEPRTPRAADLLGWGLARLREGEARLFEAHHIEGKAVAVLARELGLSERAVEGRLRRTRHALRARLAPHLRGPGAPGGRVSGDPT